VVQHVKFRSNLQKANQSTVKNATRKRKDSNFPLLFFILNFLLFLILLLG
jgi:hypothetical protein